ncbi:MAG: UDP-N-acetylmuramate dehydrogenase [Phycisphaerales bacterium]|nr:UDP-N-acetylmuramate dehydrogenase [Phycisphaerales bacterium]
MKTLEIEHEVPIPTWFGIGGQAARMARPASIDDVREALDLDRSLRVLGDGANLLVHDDGIADLVVSLSEMDEIGFDGDAVEVGAGVPLPKLLIEAARRDLEGLEGLAGIPASIGGAIRMNAGGTFGAIDDVVEWVDVVRRDGRVERLERSSIPFAYRHSGLERDIIVGARLHLRPGEAVRDRLKSCMAYKKRTQPMGEKSAGCCFRNPTLTEAIGGIGERGDRVSAGLLIDRSGGKGLRLGGAEVSNVHANFVTTHAGARASDVIELMERMQAIVMDRYGVRIEPEVVVWR